MDYNGNSRTARVRIVATTGWLARYQGQTCDAIIYDPGVNPQLNTEQLKPPLPKWQSARLSDIAELGTPQSGEEQKP